MVTIIPSQNKPGSNGNKGVLHTPHSPRTGASPSNCLVSYQGHSVVEGTYSSAEMQWVYSTALANWAWQ